MCGGGETNPLHTGFKDDGKYSWVKSPRFEGRPMQAGPLAQVLIGYAQGHKLTHKWAGEAINGVSAVSQKQVTPVMLVGNPVADTERPLEVLRTVHSFDPCVACAIHTFDPDGKEPVHVS